MTRLRWSLMGAMLGSLALPSMLVAAPPGSGPAGSIATATTPFYPPPPTRSKMVGSNVEPPTATDPRTLPTPVPAPIQTATPAPIQTMTPAAVGEVVESGCRSSAAANRKRHCRPATEPAPLGTFVDGAFRAQATLAKAERLVIYLEEWEYATAVYKPVYLSHLELIVRWMTAPNSPVLEFPVLVEPSGVENLDQVRRQTIVSLLQMRGWAAAEQRVILGNPQAEPLRGDAIERIGSGSLGAGTGATSNGFSVPTPIGFGGR